MRFFQRWLASIDFAQIVKYYAVGVIVNVIGYALFLLLLYVGMGHKLAATLLYFLGMLASFGLNRTLVFSSGVTIASGLMRLALAIAAGYGLNISILYTFVDLYGFEPGYVQLFSIVVVSVFLYTLNKFFVHRN